MFCRSRSKETQIRRERRANFALAFSLFFQVIMDYDAHQFVHLVFALILKRKLFLRLVFMPEFLHGNGRGMK